MSDIATELTVAAIQSGKLSADPEKIANFYFQLLDLLTKKFKERKDAATSNSSKAYIIK